MLSATGSSRRSVAPAAPDGAVETLDGRCSGRAPCGVHRHHDHAEPVVLLGQSGEEHRLALALFGDGTKQTTVTVPVAAGHAPAESARVRGRSARLYEVGQYDGVGAARPGSGRTRQAPSFCIEDDDGVGLVRVTVPAVDKERPQPACRRCRHEGDDRAAESTNWSTAQDDGRCVVEAVGCRWALFWYSLGVTAAVVRTSCWAPRRRDAGDEWEAFLGQGR